MLAHAARGVGVGLVDAHAGHVGGFAAVREGFDVKMTGKVPDDFKALATNAFLIDMAHLKGEDLTGVPVNPNKKAFGKAALICLPRSPS